MSTTKESIKKMLEEKRQGTKNQGTLKKADKKIGGAGKAVNNQRNRSSSVNKSV